MRRRSPRRANEALEQHPAVLCQALTSASVANREVTALLLLFAGSPAARCPYRCDRTGSPAHVSPGRS